MEQLHIHCFQHVHYEDPGCIEKWIKENNHSHSSTKFYDSYSLPDMDKIDWLIVMGGPMGVYDNEDYPWLKEEKEFIKKAILKDKTVIGICLGAQLIADVLGAKIYPNDEKEIGWFDISVTEKGADTSILEGIDQHITVFHWHGDTFDLPEEAVHLFESEGCRNQGFLYRENVLGLQFHFEVTEESLGKMVLNGKSELIPAKYVQPGEKILLGNELINMNNIQMYKILDNLADM